MNREKPGSAVPALVLGAAVLLAAIALVFGSDVGAPPVVRGSLAPEFDLERLDESHPSGRTLTLSSLRGRVVLVNFWATWCEPCESEMPAMERLYEMLPRDAFELVAVSIDDARDVVETFQQEYALSFPIVLDLDQSVYRNYQTMGVPETLLIDPEGRIVERYVGPRVWDSAEYVSRIGKLVSARAAGNPGGTPTPQAPR